jgi:hypothetical protein|tara:strand:- start:536 stop:796 length:261 start_codon:yes stop_codon:yes gene_type:complete
MASKIPIDILSTAFYQELELLIPNRLTSHVDAAEEANMRHDIVIEAFANCSKRYPDVTEGQWVLVWRHNCAQAIKSLRRVDSQVKR